MLSSIFCVQLLVQVTLPAEGAGYQDKVFERLTRAILLSVSAATTPSLKSLQSTKGQRPKPADLKHALATYSFSMSSTLVPVLQAKEKMDGRHENLSPIVLPSHTFIAPSTSILSRKSVDRRRYLSGFIAGCVSRTCTAPIDRLKVLRQAAVPEIDGLNMYKSFRKLVADDGLFSLWRGNGVNVLKNGPETALRFGFHGKLKDLLFPEAKELHPSQRLFVASLAGAWSLTLTYPMEVMKTRMALRKTDDSNSVTACTKALYSQGGLRSFYRGYAISMLSYVPYAGLELSFFELFKRGYVEYFYGYHPGDPMPHIAKPVAISLIICSSLIPMLIVYPANLMRTRFQANTNFRSPTIISMFRSILQANGLSGLYRGFLTSLSKTLPSVTITYLTFEALMEAMGLPTLGTK